jgi:hypothetical protein
MDRDVFASQRVSCQPTTSQSFTPDERFAHGGSVPSRTDILAQRVLRAKNPLQIRRECTLGERGP